MPKHMQMKNTCSLKALQEAIGLFQLCKCMSPSNISSLARLERHCCACVVKLAKRKTWVACVLAHLYFDICIVSEAALRCSKWKCCGSLKPVSLLSQCSSRLRSQMLVSKNVVE